MQSVVGRISQIALSPNSPLSCVTEWIDAANNSTVIRNFTGFALANDE